MDLLTSASSVPSAYWGDHWSWELGLIHGVFKGCGWPTFLFSSGRGCPALSEDLLSPVFLGSSYFLPVLWERRASRFWLGASTRQ